MFTTYRRGWYRIYLVILPLLRAYQKTQCVGNRTTRTNRRWGGLSTRWGFGKLARTLLPYVGRVSHTGLAQGGSSQCTSRGCSIHESRIATMETLLQAQTQRNDTLEQHLRQLEAVLTSMGVSHASSGAQRSPPTNGGSTSSASSASAGMINIV